MSREGIFYIVAAPSGAGKTSLVDALIKKVENVKVSISYTTRKKRPSETDGKNYHFISDPEFDEMITKRQFIEHANVYGKRYGTSHQWVINKLKQGVDIILEIDWQGARQISQQFPSAISIFIVPPSMQVLHDRLQARNQDKEAVIQARMQAAKDEIVHYHEFDYLVINDQFDQALDDLCHIIYANRLKCTSQMEKHRNLLEDLLEKQ